MDAGDTVVDIGANVGHYTLLMSRCVEGHGHVIAFEPIGSTFALLASNVTSAGAKNVTLINAAVRNNVERLRFRIPDGNPSRAHASEDGATRVFSIRLSDLISPDWSLSLIKVDAQSADDEIVRAAYELVEQARPYVTVGLTGADANLLAGSFTNYLVWRIPCSHNSILYPAEQDARVRASLANE